MSTRSRIAIQNQDGTVSSIYCHWDGYPENNGEILHEFYKDRNKIQSLIDLGDISSLGTEALPSEVIHSYVNPQPGVTVAYYRDRGEKLSLARIDASLEAFEKSDVEEYGYVYTLEGEWLIVLDKLKPLVEVLTKSRLN